MNANDYKTGALRTEAPVLSVLPRFKDQTVIRYLHAAMGLCTEAGEIQDGLKRHFFYGKQIDKTNLIEELGDVMWYVAIMADALGVSIEEVMQRNNAKLRARFPDKFTEEKAITRNLDGERAILEAK